MTDLLSDIMKKVQKQWYFPVPSFFPQFGCSWGSAAALQSWGNRLEDEANVYKSVGWKKQPGSSITLLSYWTNHRPVQLWAFLFWEKKKKIKQPFYVGFSLGIPLVAFLNILTGTLRAVPVEWWRWEVMAIIGDWLNWIQRRETMVIRRLAVMGGREKGDLA